MLFLFKILNGCIIFSLQLMLCTFIYSILWILLVAGFSAIACYYIQARIVCDEFKSNTESGLDDPDNCFHYVNKGRYTYSSHCWSLPFFPHLQILSTKQYVGEMAWKNCAMKWAELLWLYIPYIALQLMWCCSGEKVYWPKPAIMLVLIV